MLWRQVIIIGGSLLAAVVLQVTLLSRLGLPGATPDLVVVTVVAIALAMGPIQGATSGFVAGVLVGMAPPAVTPLGINALVYLVMGFAAGFVIDRRDRTVPLMLAIVGICAGSATLVVALIDSLVGGIDLQPDSLFAMVVTSVIYATLLAPAVVWPMAWVVRKATPEVLLA